MTETKLGRRAFMMGTAVATANLGASGVRAANDPDTFVYEITRTEEEWRNHLSDLEFFVLRRGGTEGERTSSNWNERRPGVYACKGCELPIYRSLHKMELSKGWAFFRHSYKDTVLTDLDLQGGREGDPFAELAALMEVHCRRCGSHLGHIVTMPEVPGKPIHCINGHALDFRPAEA